MLRLLALTLLSAHTPSPDPCNAANLASPPYVRPHYYSRGPVEIDEDDWYRLTKWVTDVKALKRRCRKGASK